MNKEISKDLRFRFGHQSLDNFIEISKEKLYPLDLYFSCKLAGNIFYLGYIPTNQCASEFTDEKHIDCKNYNIVLETLEEAKQHDNIAFNISIQSGSKKYDYMIGSKSVYNQNNYIRLSSALLEKSITNLCGDVGIGKHNTWNVNIIQKEIETEDSPPTYNLCFLVKNKLYYVTYAEQNVEPCYFYYIKDEKTKNTVLHKATLTEDENLAINFTISETKPF